MFDFHYDEDAIVDELGIGASEPAFRAHVLSQIRQLLDERMGIRFETELTDKQIAQLAGFGKDTDKAREFLAARFPDYPAMYSQELSIIVAQLKQNLADDQ